MQAAIRRAALTGIAAGTLGALASILPSMERAEESLGLRYLYTVRGVVEPPDDVQIVGISEASLRALELPPLDEEAGLLSWPRHFNTALIRKLDAWGVAAIVIDIHFRDLIEAADDHALAEAIEASDNVILFESVDRVVETVASGPSGRPVESVQLLRIPPHPDFTEAALATAPFLLPTEPSLTNGYFTFMDFFADRPTIAPLALAVAAGASGQWLLDQLAPITSEASGDRAPIALADRLTTAHRLLLHDPELKRALRASLQRRGGEPDLDRSAGRALALLETLGGPDTRYLNYYGPSRTINTVPAHIALARDEIAEIDWHDAIVFIGLSTETQRPPDDEFRTFYTQPSGREINGVEIMATAVANLLEGRSLRRVSSELTVVGQLVSYCIVGLALGACFLARSAMRGLTALGLLLAAYLLIVQIAFNHASAWLPVITPVLLQAPLALMVGLGLLYRRASAQHQAVAQGAGLFLPADLLRRIEQDPNAIRQSALVNGICMVTDIEQYTAFSEGLSPERLKAELDSYYESLFSIVKAHDGLVTDIVGDSMVAVWANQAEEGRERALAAALAIARQLGQGEANFPRTRIGLQAGEFILGAIGASERLEYRAVGDCVNSAARIQTLNKLLGTTLLASQDALPPDAPRRALGSFQLPGKKLLLEICEPRLASADEGQESLDSGLAAALAAFRSGDLPLACSLFERLLASFPADGPARFYLRYLRGTPPQADGHPDPVVRL